jgi:signal peptidase II
MIVGGALGNVIDRAVRSDAGFLRGSVIDFIDLQWWPVFNIADVGVVCGAILLVIATFRGSPT